GRRVGGRRPGGRMGFQRGPQTRQASRFRPRTRGDRGDAHKRRGGPDGPLRRCASILFESVSANHDKHKSKLTLDRQYPGAFEGETVTRRRFMTVGGQAAGGIAAASFLLPALGFAVGPIFKSSPHRWESVGPEDMFKKYNYVPVVLTLNPSI